MLNPHVDTLFDVAVADAFVDDDTDGGFGYVVDNTSFAVVDFVGHAMKMLDSGPFGELNCWPCGKEMRSTERQGKAWIWEKTHPFCTAPFALISTISPTLYCLRYVESLIIPFCLKFLEKAYCISISSWLSKAPLLGLLVVGLGGMRRSEFGSVSRQKPG